MSDNTAISWADATVTPIRARRKDTGKVGVHCVKVSPECANCYAEALNCRNLPAHGTGYKFTVLNGDKVDVFLDEKMLAIPMKWKRGRRIFWNSQTDAFADFVTDAMLDRMFAVQLLTRHHIHLNLTKRPERMYAYLAKEFVCNRIHEQMINLTPKAGVWAWGGMRDMFKHVHFGVTAGTQKSADERISWLVKLPVQNLFVSAEPLLEHVWIKPYWLERISQLITGGESGHSARPMNPSWARSLRDQCLLEGTAFHHKQNGEFASVSEVAGPGRHHQFPDGVTVRRVGKTLAGRLLDGVEWSQFPEVRP